MSKRSDSIRSGMSGKSGKSEKVVPESIYHPNFYRQRSVSFDNYLYHQNNSNDRTFAEESDAGSDDQTQEIRIKVISRRKSLAHNTKFTTHGVSVVSAQPTITETEINENHKKELIISIPVLIEDNCSDCSIRKETFEIDPHPYGEPVMQSSWSVLKQMLIPFLIAGIGSVGAGIVLNNVQKWPVFVAIPQLIIMVPSFLGLTGNIETTLASRLSTHANLGTLDKFAQLKSMVVGNSAVVLCQASAVGLFAGFASLGMYYATGAKDHTGDDLTVGELVLLLCSSSVTSSVIANILLATTISLVIIIARKVNINPDNIATPIAASMGDVCTITILATISSFFYNHRNDSSVWITYATLGVLLLTSPITGYIARKNRYTRSVILTGWTPILGAVIIEQPGGLVMESAFDKYDVMSTFQPLVNGIGSNLVGIQTSRLSTFLHQTSAKGKLPKSDPRACVHPLFPFIGNNVHARMARLLLGITVPAHFFYLVIIRFWQANFSFTAPFIIAYMLAVLAQIAILLYLAYGSTLWAWKRRINPDNSAIPFTSALADVLGNCLMAAAFTFLNSINDLNARIDDGDGDTINSTMTTLNYTLTSFYNYSMSAAGTVSL